MALRLQGNPEWLHASGHPVALAQGLWAGAGAIVALTLGWWLGDVGIVTALAVTAFVPGIFLLLAPADILIGRRASDARLSAALVGVLLVAATLSVIHWALPSGLPLPTPSSDAWEAAAPTLAGLLLAAERFAARGRLAWRDRALGAAAGYAIVGGVFLVGVEWLSWAVLLALLPLRLHRTARVALGVLSGAAALGLGQYVDGVWTARVIEAAAFVGYFALSMILAQRRPSHPTAKAATAAPGEFA